MEEVSVFVFEAAVICICPHYVLDHVDMAGSRFCSENLSDVEKYVEPLQVDSRANSVGETGDTYLVAGSLLEVFGLIRFDSGK